MPSRDFDGNGKVEAKEVVHGLCEMGMEATEAELLPLAESFDDDGNGVIDLDELKIAFKRHHELKLESEKAIAAAAMKNEEAHRAAIAGQRQMRLEEVADEEAAKRREVEARERAAELAVREREEAERKATLKEAKQREKEAKQREFEAKVELRRSATSTANGVAAVEPEAIW